MKLRSLPFDIWPEADRNAWSTACRPAARLRRGGAAGHLKPVTRDVHERHYGNFLGFLDRDGLLRREEPAAANVTPENVDVYVAEAKAAELDDAPWLDMRLRRAARFIAPGRDFTWLAEMGKDLALVAQPRSKFDRLVLPEVLIEAGLTLIHEAEHSQTMTELARASQVRNGLMVALLGFRPIRRKNFAALEIGRSFVKIHGKWWIVLSAAETKEKRADERRVDELLIPLIDRYLDRYRPVLIRSDTPSSPLALLKARRAHSRQTRCQADWRDHPFDCRCEAESPSISHLCRLAAAVYGGDNPYLGSAVLHNADPSVT